MANDPNATAKEIAALTKINHTTVLAAIRREEEQRIAVACAEAAGLTRPDDSPALGATSPEPL